jgi:hypothetical protein
MENEPKSGRFVLVNPKLSSIEIDLPPHLEKYAEEIKEKIREQFSFRMMDSSLEEKVQLYIEDYLRGKGEL